MPGGGPQLLISYTMLYLRCQHNLWQSILDLAQGPFIFFTMLCLHSIHNNRTPQVSKEIKACRAPPTPASKS